ncbi:MAG: hypothetical protein BWX50_01351 [Euryarchaeota archaeon ADurb.Bin009]|nr:MAG: hypothetical protein BWX50_01351 [Euryarchaeota archaeon ADurb.Bin009]
MEPPGWTRAVAPAAAATSRVSGKGRNASDATAVPARGRRAFLTAISADSTRFICPAPIPMTAFSSANMMALLFVCRQTFQARCIARISWAVGSRSVTTCQSSRKGSVRWTRAPPSMLRMASCTTGSGSRSTRMFSFAFMISSASGVNDGATTTSTNVPVSSRATSAATSRFIATIEP